ncbi:MAG: urea transport system ATP-binding protein [Lentimonas sp.]|jgi:urea transport system ATP-binding protein
MPSDTDFLLAIEDLTVSFDGFKAVDALTLYVDKGELRVIIGPNGAGKTTVLDLISGKTKSTSGSIRYKNVELTTMREHEIVRAGIGRKFQTPSIYEKLTVFENLEISYPWGRNVLGSLRFKRSEEVVTRICNIAEEIFLQDMLELPAELLSHGQKQWLEIGMLLVQDPELVMLDEPVAGMTAKERDATALLLRKIAKERSIVVVEHDMDFVAKIADRVTVLHLGKIIKEGTMDEVRNDPTVQEVYLGH